MSRLFPTRWATATLALALALALGVLVATACAGDVPQAANEPSDTDEASPPAAAPDRTPPPPEDTVPLAERCIRGGTPRADVARIMGEPDSTVYGSWFFGSSEILFGYGVVLEIRDRGELILCDGA